MRQDTQVVRENGIQLAQRGRCKAYGQTNHCKLRQKLKNVRESYAGNWVMTE